MDNSQEADDFENLAEKEQRECSGVNRVFIMGSLKVLMEQGDKNSLEIAAEYREDLEKIKTKKNGSTLEIRVDGDVRNVSENGNVVIGNVSFGNVFNQVVLNGVNVQQGTSFVKGGLKGQVLVKIMLPELKEVSVMGSGEVKADGVDQKKINLSVQGSGEISVSGRVDSMIASVQGSGKIKTKRLISEKADLSVQGSGKIKCWVSNSADASVMVSGDIRILGNPETLKKSVMGSGKIKKEESSDFDMDNQPSNGEGMMKRGPGNSK